MEPGLYLPYVKRRTGDRLMGLDPALPTISTLGQRTKNSKEFFKKRAFEGRETDQALKRVRCIALTHISKSRGERIIVTKCGGAFEARKSSL